MKSLPHTWPGVLIRIYLLLICFVEVEHHAGELFPRVGFIVTNLQTDSRAVVSFYNKRGTAEQWIKEGKQAVKMTRQAAGRLHPHAVPPAAEWRAGPSTAK